MGQFRYDDEPIDIGPSTNIVLERIRVDAGDREVFRLHRTISYDWVDARTGAARTYVVPPDAAFETDLASVPQLLTWLVPKSGRHLPAALVHDAFVDEPSPGADRFEADRVFRDGMGDLGVGLIRRWLMWTAVTLATIRTEGSSWLRWSALGSLVVVVVLGILATINLAVDTTLVPWMGDRGVWSELAFGLAGAIVIPIVLGALLWPQVRVAGVTAGVAIAVLLHAMAVIGIVYAGYLIAERQRRWVQVVVGAMTVGGATVLFVWALLTNW